MLENNLTLGCVCAACNQYFGQHLDICAERKRPWKYAWTKRARAQARTRGFASGTFAGAAREGVAVRAHVSQFGVGERGLQQSGVLVAEFDFSPLKIPVAARPQYKRDLLASVRTVPGVDAAAEAINVPLGNSFEDRFIDIPEKGVNRREVNVNRVSDQFFRTLEVPLLAGRDFDKRDTPNSPPVAIVNTDSHRPLQLSGFPVTT